MKKTRFMQLIEIKGYNWQAITARHISNHLYLRKSDHYRRKMYLHHYCNIFDPLETPICTIPDRFLWIL